MGTSPKISTGRFSVGQKILFILTKYNRANSEFIEENGNHVLKYTGFSKVISDDTSYNPIYDKLIALKGVVLTVTEHHKVYSEYDDHTVTQPAYDGYKLIDDNGKVWTIQYPNAVYGQMDDSRDHIATNAHRNIESVQVVLRNCRLPKDKTVSSEVKTKIAEFRTKIEQIIKDNDFQIVETPIVNGDTFMIERVIPNPRVPYDHLNYLAKITTHMAQLSTFLGNVKKFPVPLQEPPNDLYWQYNINLINKHPNRSRLGMTDDDIRCCISIAGCFGNTPGIPPDEVFKISKIIWPNNNVRMILKDFGDCFDSLDMVLQSAMDCPEDQSKRFWENY